ncbi:MAG: NUDIX domain-containing protein [Candidatus Marinimicrobia bacterium]|nr:NUDIX domain-containing protein [Candidatus Neomarinimicrobiota bacterium]MBL7022947.1 NUDIX domain-containing protein [Candidatus Neomarinimicrobiota bacterium]MBL7108765.1 NUDIX domain-containing protein [Candidatus Neomarinimicrobiota bacterium]
MNSSNINNTHSAGGVVLNPNGEVLVVSQHGTSWSLPKGHIDAGENKIQAARREIYEESGVDKLELIEELGSYKRYRIGLDGNNDLSEFKTIYIFLFKTSQTKLQPKDKENPEARWVVKNEVTKLLTHPKDIEFYNSIIEQI